ncbi:MAG: hypothetical protein ACK5HT_02150 [Draconibacterium sp.]
MKFAPEYIVFGLLILIGLIGVIFKPFYEDDRRINLRKASIYQGWALVIFGLCLLILRISLPGWWPLGLFVGVLVFVIIMLRLKKVCYIKNESENLTFSRENQRRKAKITKRYILIFAIGLTIFLFTNMIIRPSIKIVDNKFKISGKFGFEYPLNEIVQVDTLQRYPSVELMTGGSGFAGSYKGSFKLRGYGQGKLFLKKGIRPYVYIKFENNDFIFLNLKSSKQTIDFYNELILKTNK